MASDHKVAGSSPAGRAIYLYTVLCAVFFVIIKAMNLKILFLVIFLASVSVFGTHQSAQAEDHLIIEKLRISATPNNPAPNDSVVIKVLAPDIDAALVTSYYVYTILISEEGSPAPIKICQKSISCEITISPALNAFGLGPAGNTAVTKTYTAKLIKIWTSQGLSTTINSAPLTVSWKITLDISVSDETPAVGTPITITATSNRAVEKIAVVSTTATKATRERGLYRFRIYENATELQKQEWSCSTGSVCKTPQNLDGLSPNNEAVKFYTADISRLIDKADDLPPYDLRRIKEIVASTEPITVVWGVSTLDISASTNAPALGATDVTITAVAKKTVQGTSYYIRIYEEGNPEPLETCETDKTCSVRVSSPIVATQSTYTADVSKWTQDQGGRNIKVVQSRGSTTVTWGEAVPMIDKTKFWCTKVDDKNTGAPKFTRGSDFNEKDGTVALADGGRIKITGGLVPCGRECDDPTTTKIDEAADCTFCSFFYLFNNIVKWVVTIIVPSIAVLLIAIGGFMLAMSRGNPGQSQKGKDILIWTLAGIAVMFIGWAVLNSLLSGIGVMKWTGLRAETGEFEKYEVRTDGDHLLQDFDIDKKSDEAWERSDKGSGWKGLTVELSHLNWSEPQIRKITSNNEHSIRIDKPLYNTTQEKGAKIKYKIGGWWQFSCGTE